MAIRISELHESNLQLHPFSGVEVGEPEDGCCQLFATFKCTYDGSDLHPYTVVNVAHRDVESFIRSGFTLLICE